jgi:hypothetical protein
MCSKRALLEPSRRPTGEDGRINPRLRDHVLDEKDGLGYRERLAKVFENYTAWVKSGRWHVRDRGKVGVLPGDSSSRAGRASIDRCSGGAGARGWPSAIGPMRTQRWTTE